MTLAIDALLEKYPGTKEIFEKNQALLSKCPPEKKRNTDLETRTELGVRLTIVLSANPGQRRRISETKVR